MHSNSQSRWPLLLRVCTVFITHVIGSFRERTCYRRHMRLVLLSFVLMSFVLLIGSASALSLPAAAPVVVLGPGSLDLRLLTAKLSARAGLKTSLFAASGAAQDIWLEQMYGIEDPSMAIEESSDPLRPVMVSDDGAREAALAAAEGLALISDGVSMPEAALSSVLQAAPQLRRIVCLSKMGVTRVRERPFSLNKVRVVGVVVTVVGGRGD